MEREIVFNKAMVKGQGKLAQSLDVFNSLPDWVWVREVDGRLVDINESALKRTGYAREDVIGRPISELYFNAHDKPRGQAWSQRLLKDGSGYLSVTFRDKQGRPIEVEQHGRVIELGGKRLILIVARDIGQHLRDKRLSLIMHEAFRRSNDVMFYCDRNGTILDVNEAFTRHYRWTREEVIGQTPRILKSRHSSKDLYERMWGAILTKGFWRGEMINKSKDGREIPLILTITAVRDQHDEIVGYISNAVDMTEHMALQARVADSEALASVGEMAAVVAHEIRNPLGSIVMAAKELATEQLSPDDREVVLRVLRNESHRLNETLTNFLSFARPRDLKLERSDLNAIVDEVARAARANPELIGQVELELELGKSLKPFPFDADQVRQIVWNMLINAVQALTGRAGVVKVRTGRRDGHAFFEVSDTGPGIPAAVRSTLFKPFQTTKQKGTGLGLAVADRVVKAHGGSIAVETGPKGTTFTVSLPPSGE